MRLICPRCGEKYEIDDDLIPPSGREVECSSCESAWFQAGRLRMTQSVDPAPFEPQGSILPASETAEEEDSSHLPPLPQPSKALSPDLLSLLRDEAKQFQSENPELVAKSGQNEAEQPTPQKAEPTEEESVPSGYPQAPTQDPVTSRQPNFGKGFMIGLGISAVLFTLYWIAPYAGQGDTADALRGIHDAGNSLHAWISAKASSLLGN